MINRRLPLLILLCVTVMACKYPAVLVATNESSADKNIRVIFPENFKLNYHLDSLQAWDLSRTQNEIAIRDRYRYALKIPVDFDTLGGMLTFTLKAGHEATVIGSPVSLSLVKKMFVTADLDTLKFKRGTGVWEYVIK